MSIRVYNTLSRSKEPFEPIRPDKIGIYLCGPTVYMNSHIGHGVGPVIFDTIKRYLTYRGFEVTLVINITDIEDKLIDRAAKENTTIKALAEAVTENYFENLKKLSVFDNVDHWPRATEYVADIIEYVGRIIDNGYGYLSEGDVYYDIGKLGEYGRLSNRKLDEMQAGTRVAPDEKKRNPLDFVLWKSSKPGEPSWDSPWGPGRPGWHIECSVMSNKLLGEQFDIHGGGMELIFPHHEDEIAQAMAATGKPPVKYWLHNGLMKLSGEKMSKSLGNLVTMDELFEKHDPELIRFFLLSTHYRRPIDFSEKNILKVRTGLEQFYRLFERIERITGTSPYQQTPSTEVPELLAEVRKRFEAAMDDDFNTAGAIAAMYEGVSAVNAHVDRAGLDSGEKLSQEQKTELLELVGAIRFMGGLLGVFEKPREKVIAFDEATVTALKDMCTELGDANADDLAAKQPEELIEMLIEMRAQARKDKDFTRSDAIRERLSDLGITLEDHPGGTTWSVT